MAKFSAVIVDDEEDARVTLRSFIGTYCPELQLVGEASGVKSGLEAIRICKPDIVFLDIQMEDGTGFDLLEQNTEEFSVIFTTAYDQYAIKAFRFSAIDYLLKPIDPTEMKAAVEKATSIREAMRPKVEALLASEKSGRVDHLALSSFGEVNVVELREIARLEADSNYTHVHLLDGKRITVTKPLKEYEDILSAEGFFRIHQSHMVRLDLVDRLVKEGLQVHLRDGKVLPLARRRKDEFLALLKNGGAK